MRVSRLGASLLLAALAAALIGGCATPAYYLQAIGGQLEIFRSTRSLDEARTDPAVSADVQRRLAVVGRLRDFASRELALPDNGSYRRYADLGRPYVVWNVFVAGPLSLQAMQWCFPIAGCVGYRGYFSETAAKEFAAERRAAGDDVAIGGVPAYSTLGWFDDPVLNTFINYPDIELARLLFHELAHQVVYAPDDTTFNESFAVTVEEAGVMRWVQAHGDPLQRVAFHQGGERRSDFHGLIKTARERLTGVYAEAGSAASRLAKKALVLNEIKASYRVLRDGKWGGFSGYDRWFSDELNNASLASVGLYLDRVPAFRALLAENGDDLPRFYAAVRALASLPSAQREAQLGEVLARRAPAMQAAAGTEAATMPQAANVAVR